MDLQCKFSGSSPVYVQIMEHIRSAVMAGEYAPGGRIPPVRELAAQAQVNPNTMQRALLELEREGLLVTQGTMGRFVTNDPVVLEAIRQNAVDKLIRSCAKQFKAMGITMAQAVALLQKLEQEEMENE